MDEIQIITREFEEMKTALPEARAKLVEKNTELTHNVEELEKNKRAITNLLEDLDAEKKQVEAKVILRTRELAEERAQLVASINSLALGFLLIDNNERIILKNPAVTRIFGLAGDNLSLETLAGALRDNFDLASRCRECLITGKVTDQKDILFGSKFLRIFIAPVMMLRDHNEIIGAVVLVEDITEAKVVERSREEFFAVASHELRTPLTAIRGNMALIKDFFAEKLKDPQVKEMIDDSYGASVRLIGIVNDFLDASRLEQGKVSFKTEKIDAMELIKEVVREVGALAKSKNLTLEVKDFNESALVLADRDRAKQIVYNLVSNAINYTQKGGIVIEVKKEKGFLRVFVTDTGDGISQQNQALLFRKFQQAGEKMLARDVTKSTGLGLYISKLILEGMGGKAWLERSELGKGSTFAFALPLAS